MEPIQLPNGAVISAPVWDSSIERWAAYSALVNMYYLAALWVRMFPFETPPHLEQFGYMADVYIQRWGY